MSSSDLNDRLRGLVQRIRAPDDRGDLAGFDRLLEDDEVVLLPPHDERPQRLPHKQ